MIWTIYGGAMLIVGIMRESRLLRVMALILLSLTTLKVFFWDLAALDRVYRIISFVVLGAILLSFLHLSKGQTGRAGEGALISVYAPNACDPWQQQDCWNRGGTRDHSTCQYYGGSLY